MKRFLKSFFTLSLPILVFLIISTTVWQQIDDYNTELENKFYKIKLEANGEDLSYGGCGTGLIYVNANVQNVIILLLSFGFLNLIFKKSCSKFSQYFPILLSILIVFIFNLLVQFLRFDFYYILNSKDLGFFARYTTLPDLFLWLLYLLLIITLILHFCYFVKNKFQAKISLK